MVVAAAPVVVVFLGTWGDDWVWCLVLVVFGLFLECVWVVSAFGIIFSFGLTVVLAQNVKLIHGNRTCRACQSKQSAQTLVTLGSLGKKW